MRVANDGPETSEASLSEGEGTGEKEIPSCENINSLKNGRIRRNRTSFSSKQLEVLEAAFNLNTYPDQDERERIALETNLSEDKIMAITMDFTTWFSNRRARCRKNFAFTGTNSLLVQNITPMAILPHSPVQQPQVMPIFSSHMNLLSYSATSASPVKFQDPSTSILFYPQYATL
ncbi:unnamed protein product [Thelazia callipaeda]|uniref:Homeobox domain-containing protein n=1 Tax=Thelazia callipaeda TaxID=103827 RepID=A0A158RBI7_THECL|nr:unnamed protein product [Thelazia callipaeda]